ncbi:hypothetical protein CDIK_2365 [Cucumispora dikerogammari]|nr:hypothetical protein CDIK_2365 [Cucumispora dikerogammari]
MTNIIAFIFRILCRLTELKNISFLTINTEKPPVNPLTHSAEDDNKNFSFTPFPLSLSCIFTSYLYVDIKSFQVSSSLHLLKFIKNEQSELNEASSVLNIGKEIDLKRFKDKTDISLSTQNISGGETRLKIKFLGSIYFCSQFEKTSEIKETTQKFEELLDIEGEKIENAEFILVAQIIIKEKNRLSSHILTRETNRFQLIRSSNGDNYELRLKKTNKNIVI